MFRGSLAVTYDYTPASGVPEPGTVVMAGLGMIVVLLRWRLGNTR